MPANPAPMAIAKAADRRRLQDRMRCLAELAELMRQPGTLAEPVPLHRTGCDGATVRTTS